MLSSRGRRGPSGNNDDDDDEDGPGGGRYRLGPVWSLWVISRGSDLLLLLLLVGSPRGLQHPQSHSVASLVWSGGTISQTVIAHD